MRKLARSDDLDAAVAAGEGDLDWLWRSGSDEHESVRRTRRTPARAKVAHSGTAYVEVPT
jgi:hypothetical protein